MKRRLSLTLAVVAAVATVATVAGSVREAAGDQRSVGVFVADTSLERADVPLEGVRKAARTEVPTRAKPEANKPITRLTLPQPAGYNLKATSGSSHLGGVWIQVRNWLGVLDLHKRVVIKGQGGQ